MAPAPMSCEVVRGMLLSGWNNLVNGNEGIWFRNLSRLLNGREMKEVPLRTAPCPEENRVDRRHADQRRSNALVETFGLTN